MPDFSDILLTVDYDRTMTAPDSTVPQRNLEAIQYFPVGLNQEKSGSNGRE